MVPVERVDNIVARDDRITLNNSFKIAIFPLRCSNKVSVSNLGASGLSVSLLLCAPLLKLSLLIDLNFLIFFHQTCIKKLSSRQWKNFSFLVEKL